MLALAVCWLGGCATVYQPLSGLHRPVAIDTRYANFTDLGIALQCLPGPLLNQGQARLLCRKLQRVFENQGATVRTRTSLGRPSAEDEKQEGPDRLLAPTASTPAPGSAPVANSELTIRLRTRVIHKKKTYYFIFWGLLTDYTFAQDVHITDENGFLLAQGELTGRLVKRLRFKGNDKEFSKDFYDQLSQLALNAKLRRQILRESDAPMRSN